MLSKPDILVGADVWPGLRDGAAIAGWMDRYGLISVGIVVSGRVRKARDIFPMESIGLDLHRAPEEYERPS